MHDLQLQAGEIVKTADLLRRRIYERFPASGLGGLCERLVGVARRASSRSAHIARPIWLLRLASMALVGLIIGGLAVTVTKLEIPRRPLEFAEFVQVLESGINDVVLIGAGVFFLVTLETRIKRNRALQAVHELRVIAHIIDMHQLTKDPDRVLSQGLQTDSSPDERRTSFELGRYLDYCSEMLSLTGKIAALYVQRFSDAATVAAVNDLESLSTGLSRKIWQKIMILQSHPSHPSAAEATPAFRADADTLKPL